MRALISTILLFCLSPSWSLALRAVFPPDNRLSLAAPLPPDPNTIPRDPQAFRRLSQARNTPLPPQPNEGTPALPGHRGVWTDSIGDTNVQYGYDPVHGIPKHNKHVSYNYAKYPENNDAFPVNRDSKQAKDDLRTAMIGNKPEDPGSGTSRDHKPPNVQKLTSKTEIDPATGRARVLTTEERKQRNTVQRLPTSESNAEMKLLAKAKANAELRGNNGMIRINEDRKPETPGQGGSRPSSSASSLKSDEEAKKNRKPPRQRPPPGPPPSPRRLRSSNNQGGGSSQASGSGTHAGGTHQASTQGQNSPRRDNRPDSPQSRIPKPATGKEETKASVKEDTKASVKERAKASSHSTPRKDDRRASSPSRIPAPATKHDEPRTPAHASSSSPRPPSTPAKSRIPVPVTSTPNTPTVSSLTSGLRRTRLKRRDLAVAIALRNMKRDAVTDRAIARIVIRDLMYDEDH